MARFRRLLFFTILLALTLASAPAENETPAPSPLDRIKPLVDARRFEEAERLARTLLDEATGSHGAESMEAAQAIDALVQAQLAQTDPPLEEMRRVAERAVAIKRARFKEPTLELAISINNLGRVHLEMSSNELGRGCFQECARIREKLLGPHHMDVGKALNNEALTLVRMGEYAEARPLYDRVIDIFKKAGAREYPEMAAVKNNVALLLKSLSDYKPARTMLEEVLRTQEAALGPEAPPLGGTLGNLADLSFSQGDMAAARRYWERALAIWGKDPGVESSPYAAAKAQLGAVLLRTGELAHGRQLVESALARQEKLGLTSTKERGTYLNYEAYALAGLGDMPAAKINYQRSVDVIVAVLGQRHPLVAGHRLDLAEHLYRMDEFGAAFAQAMLAEQIARNNLVDTFPVLSERQAIHAESGQKPGLGLALTLLIEAPPASLPADAIERTWDAIVRSRALVLDEMAARQRKATRPEAPGGPADRLARARRDLSRLLVVGQGRRSLEDYERDLHRAVEAREAAERDLAQVSTTFHDTLAERRAGWPEVRTALPDGAALVAYVRYSRCHRALGVQWTSSYVALVLDTDHKKPRLVQLGESKGIEDAIEAWRGQAGVDPRAGNLRERSRAYDRVADRLRSLIWDPLWTGRKTPPRVIVVPDGSIHLVSFATLAQPHGGYLVESGPVVHYVAAERDLVSPPRAAKGRGELVVVGGPDFDSAAGVAVASTTGAAPAPAPASAPPVAAAVDGGVPADALDSPSVASGALRSPRSVCTAFGSVTFDPLPQSLAEAEDVASLWAAAGVVRKLTGRMADEAAVKLAAPGARVLHISTHAFFMGDRCGQTENSSSTSPDVAYEETLLFSGLALAGANRRREGDSADDGILTAEEISGLDLSDTDWVVLSACETGVGRVLSGEGVLGLRRAFETASSRTLIMSLWRVEDDATRAWMHALYRNRLDGLSTADAVTRASRDLLSSRRRRGLSTHPFFWGAFVSSGDWR